MARVEGQSSRGGRGLAFLARFAGLLLLFSGVLTLKPVDAAVVEPFTAGIARVCGAILKAAGEPVAVQGTEIRSEAFAVQIENGCNGLETILLYTSAVLAFPAPWRKRLSGLLLGVAAIQAFNLVRVVTLFWIGAHRPALFQTSHTVVWQSLVVLVGVLLFLVWAARSEGVRPGAAVSKP